MGGWMDHVWPQKSWIASAPPSPPLHQAMLSAAPGSNIHLAWCIPELETLMWFVGESRWQVHGSALLTDRVGASGVVHNNSQRLSPPFSLFRRSIYITPPKPIFNTPPTRAFFFFFSPPLPDINVSTTRLHREAFGMLTFSSALSASPSLVLLSLLFSRSLCSSYFVSMRISTVLFHYAHSYSHNTLAHAP